MKPPKIDGKAERDHAAKWIDRIKSATAYEKGWLEDAEKAETAYTNEVTTGESLGKGYDYNIVYANIETIVPAIINSTPVPDIRRRFADNDEPARIVADVLERAIRVQTDDSRLQTELEAMAQDSFCAGRGVVRVRFYSDIVGGEPKHDEIEDALRGDDVSGNVGDDEERASGKAEPSLLPRLPGGSWGGENQNIPEPTLERVENERIVFEAVSWRDFRHGPAKRWDQVPWVAFRFVVAHEDEADEFDGALIDAQMTDGEKSALTGAPNDVCGWEVWCRKSRTVYFVSDEGVMLRKIPDPLELTTGLAGAFPICRPVQPIEVNGRLRPVNPVSIYRRLADELDDITKRINVLVNAVRVRGWYAGLQKELENVIHLGDNEFTPLADAEIWAQNGGIEGAIAFWPIEKFVVALRELYTAREQTKAAIYEITGISDIIRGASAASETATAQNIKSQWGSLRIQKMQRMIERAARDVFVMTAELIATKFTAETLQEMTGINLTPSQEDMTPLAPPPPTGQPEQDQQAMGQFQQAEQQRMERLATLEKIRELLGSKIASRYRIDVESDSTIRADLTRQKQEVAEFLQGAAAYFQAVAPLVQQGALPADAAVDIFASTARMFNLGKSVEDTLEKMVVEAKKKAQEPQQEKPDPEMVKAQMEAERAKTQAGMEAEKSMREFQLRGQELSQKAQIDQDKHAAAMQKASIDIQRAEIDLEKARVDLQRAIAAANAPPRSPASAAA